jgi:hypothetical protein
VPVIAAAAKDNLLPLDLVFTRLDADRSGKLERGELRGLRELIGRRQ